MRPDAKSRFETKKRLTQMIQDKNIELEKLESLARKQNAIIEVYQTMIKKLGDSVGIKDEKLNSLEIATELDKILMTTEFYEVK
jgi:hypothetical protein